VKRRLGALDWWLVVALETSWGVVLARGREEGITTGYGRVYVGLYAAAATDAYPTVRAVALPGWNPGLEAGDEILSLAGEDVVGRTAAYVYARAARVALDQGTATLQVRRGPATFRVPIGLTPTRAWWLYLAVSSINMLLALMLLVWAPGSHVTRRFLIATWALSVATVISPLLVAPRSLFEAGLRCLLHALGAALIVRIAQDFTRSARPIPWVLGAMVGVVFGLFLALYLSLGFLPYWGISITTLGLLAVVAYVGSGLVGLLRAYARIRSSAGRRAGCCWEPTWRPRRGCSMHSCWRWALRSACPPSSR
jgi:hypothetical protein